jgi:broad specificity phosphatase PhoE
VLTLVLTRHGLTPRSDPEQHLGQHIDIGLSEEGLDQARALAARIGDEHFDWIVASPLRRAAETARVIAGDRPVELDPRLMEMDYGRWEGLTYDGIDVVDGDYRRRWTEDPADLSCPGGESGNDVATRARSFLADQLAASPGPTERIVLAVAHASLNRVLLCVAMGVPVAQYRRRFTQGQTNLTVLRYAEAAEPEAARLLVLNDLGHALMPGRAPWELRPGA